MNKFLVLNEEHVIHKIYIIRGRKVLMDRDLAEMYGVETRVLNQAVRRNSNRFPPDFMFQLTQQELLDWKSQFVTSKREKLGMRKLPNVFTEQGVAMLSSVLKSETAIEVNIQLIRIFSRIREMLIAHKDILLKLEQLGHKVLRQDKRAKKQEEDINLIFTTLKQLLARPDEPSRKIGFGVNRGE